MNDWHKELEFGNEIIQALSRLDEVILICGSLVEDIILKRRIRDTSIADLLYYDEPPTVSVTIVGKGYDFSNAMEKVINTLTGLAEKHGEKLNAGEPSVTRNLSITGYDIKFEVSLGFPFKCMGVTKVPNVTFVELNSFLNRWACEPVSHWVLTLYKLATIWDNTGRREAVEPSSSLISELERPIRELTREPGFTHLYNKMMEIVPAYRAHQDKLYRRGSLD